MVLLCQAYFLSVLAYFRVFSVGRLPQFIAQAGVSSPWEVFSFVLFIAVLTLKIYCFIINTQVLVARRTFTRFCDCLMVGQMSTEMLCR